MNQNVTILPTSSFSPAQEEDIKSCYLKYHPDAKWWIPGDKNGVHISEWARFDVQDIYYVGGFGE